MQRWRRTAAVVAATFRYGAIRTTLHGNDGKTRALFVSTPPKPRLVTTEPHERRRASASVDEPAGFLFRPCPLPSLPTFPLLAQSSLLSLLIIILLSHLSYSSIVKFIIDRTIEMDRSFRSLSIDRVCW